MEKIFKGFLIVNWKTGAMRMNKKNPNRLSPFDIKINVNLTVEIPEKKEMKFDGKIKISEEKLAEMVFESI